MLWKGDWHHTKWISFFGLLWIFGSQRHRSYETRNKNTRKLTKHTFHVGRFAGLRLITFTYHISVCISVHSVSLFLSLYVCSANFGKRALYADDYGSNNGNGIQATWWCSIEEKLMHWMVNFSRPTKWPRKHTELNNETEQQRALPSRVLLLVLLLLLFCIYTHNFVWCIDISYRQHRAWEWEWKRNKRKIRSS